MAERMQSMKHHNVWKLVELPKGQRTVGNRWIFKTKTDADGTITKYKARWVIQGFLQVPGKDLKELYSPVARFDSIEAILAVAAKRAWYLRPLRCPHSF